MISELNPKLLLILSSDSITATLIDECLNRYQACKAHLSKFVSVESIFSHQVLERVIEMGIKNTESSLRIRCNIRRHSQLILKGLEDFEKFISRDLL